MSMRDLLKGPKLFYADLILIVVGVVGSFALRLNLEQLILDYIPALAIMLVTALIVKSLLYRRMGLYQRLWAYASIEEMRLIVRTVTIASALVAAIVLGLHLLGVFARLPRSVFIIDWLASLAFVGGLRFGLRLLTESETGGGQPAATGSRKVLIVGAGSAGALVVRELQKNKRSGITPVAFVDDDAEKQGHKVHDIEIVGKLDQLAEIARQRQASEVIFAIPSASGHVLRRVAERCREANLAFRTMPGIYELIGGAVSVNRLREVDITDLLRRQPATIDRERVGASLRDKIVMITGAGGSIASELCRQVARWEPAALILLGHGENSIFEILLELASDFPDLDIHPYIADIRNDVRLKRIIQRHKPQVLFHAAAHKHVPLMEINAAEAVTNNILGTQHVVDAAIEAGVGRVVMISTDKAVRPTSVMGASKRVAEWLVLDAAGGKDQVFSVVRFGNVLGSRGSVVPLFKKQIEMGGPVTITHPDMERYFMTIPEAVHLVLQAATFDQETRSKATVMLSTPPPSQASSIRERGTRSRLSPAADSTLQITRSVTMPVRPSVQNR